MLTVRELKEKLNRYKDETEIAFELNFGTNYENTTRVNLCTIDFIDYLGEFDNELIFKLYDDEQLTNNLESKGE